MEKFTIGLLLGAVGGALLAANSCKMRTLVRKGQEEVKQRLDEMMDEKLKDMENGGGVFPRAAPKTWTIRKAERARARISRRKTPKAGTARKGRNTESNFPVRSAFVFTCF